MYSSNMLRIWSKRWCVMGTPVAGSCSWHRLWGKQPWVHVQEAEAGGLPLGGDAPAGPQLSAGLGRQCTSPRRAVGHGPMPWSHTALPREHSPPKNRV